jgi:hypothetical protein
MLCSLGHDDIQFWLMQKENREKLRQIFNFKLSLTASFAEEFAVEFRFKPIYEPEEYYDGIENYRYTQSSPSTIKTDVLYEIKPELTDLGQTLRQLRKYMAHTNPNKTILLYNTSKIPNEAIKQYFNTANILTYRLLPNECKRLEEY